MLLLASKSAKDDYCAGRVSLECSQSRPCTAHPTSPTAKRRPATNSAPPSSEKKAAPNASTISSMPLCCTGRGSGRTGPYPDPGSCDADGLRASQLQHAVERVDADVDLGHAAPVGVRVQPVPDHALVPRDGRLGPGAGV